MIKKKVVVRRLAVLLAACLTFTSASFTSLAATGNGNTATEGEASKQTLSLDRTDLSLTVGETATITAEIAGAASVSNATGSDATLKVEDVQWTVSNKDVITLSATKGEKVTVTAADVEQDSTATVTAKVGDLTAECVVKVTRKVSETDPSDPEETLPPINPDIEDSASENDKVVIDAIKDKVDDIAEGVQIGEVKTDLPEDKPLESDEAESVAAEAVEKTTTIKKNLDDFEVDHEAAAAAGNVDPGKEQAAEVLKDIDLESIGLESADIEKIELQVEVKAPVVKVKVTRDADGKAVTQVVVMKVSLEIKLVAGEKEIDLKKANNTVNLTVPFILPDDVDPDANWALIKHNVKDGKETKSKIYSANGKRFIKIVSSHFSPFDITFQENEPEGVEDVESIENSAWKKTSNNRRGGGGGSSSTTQSKATAQWIQNATGWWYKNADGTWPANTWVQLSWNNAVSWYRFNADGYMVAGWFTDADQNRYFLHNVSDGTQGYMYTGWHQIDGSWYYFRENAGGPMGSLVVNEVTPDGYTVDANGVCATYPNK